MSTALAPSLSASLSRDEPETSGAPALGTALAAFPLPENTVVEGRIASTASSSHAAAAPASSTIASLISPPDEQAQGVLSSAAQQAPRPVVLRKKAKSLVSRLMRRPSAPRRTYSSNSRSVSNSRISPSYSNEGSQQRTSAGTSNRYLVFSTPTLVPDSKIVHKSSSLSGGAPLMMKSSVDHGQSAPWSRFRRQSTAATQSSCSLNRFDTTERVDDTEYDEEEIIVFDHIKSPRLQRKKNQVHFANMNVLQWLGKACPTDVLPNILAYCGPQMTMRLQSVDRFWYSTIRQESTWKIMCQALYKWKPGEAEPASWKAYYCENPCVPVDYTTVHHALEASTGENVRIWLRPGRYQMKESIKIDREPSHKVSVVSMSLPSNIYQPPPSLPSSETDPVNTVVENQRTTRRAKGLMKFIRCTGAAHNDVHIDDDEESVASESDNVLWTVPQPLTRATLVLRSRRLNEPAIRVQRGQFAAEGIDIEHSSQGLDIWNGNAAIQIQPPQPEQDGSPPVLPTEELPVARLSGMRVTSRSGRGVVTIDGGQLTMKTSRVHQCAATGVYIGGRGTRAVVSQTDVVRNGLGSQGNARRNGGIARNHSGIYLEQGVADIIDCNVSNNTLTGITAVSTENSTLLLRDSDLQGNGSFQLEIPSRNSRGITMQQNRLESSGTGRPRAILGN